MGRGGCKTEADGGSDLCVQNSKRDRFVTYQEFCKHNSREDQWLLINGKAYDATKFAQRHPGGAKILNHYAGEDATDAWVAFHNDKEKVEKYMKSLYVGDVVDIPKVSLECN